MARKNIGLEEQAYKMFYATLGLIMTKRQGFVNPSQAIQELCICWKEHNSGLQK